MRRQEVNNRVRSSFLQKMLPYYPKNNIRSGRIKDVVENRILLQESPSTTMESENVKAESPSISKKERTIALLQDVEELKKKLINEVNVRRVLERALTLSNTPSSPSTHRLPLKTSQLLEEVAALEKEVIGLEEQVLSYRREIYQEAVLIMSSNCKETTEKSGISSQSEGLESSMSSRSEKMYLADLLSDSDDVKNSSEFGEKKAKKKKKKKKNTTKSNSSKTKDKQKTTTTPTCDSTENNIETSTDESGSPNKIAENTLKCLMAIFTSSVDVKSTTTEDPYGICSTLALERRDHIGRYNKQKFISINHSHPIHPSSASPSLLHNLKILLRKLAYSDLRGLTHHQKLAFWINIYNSCMMNAFLEHGTPTCSHMVAELMQKAMVNVDGHFLSAMIIEHFILRLPFNRSNNEHSLYTWKDEIITVQSKMGLDRPEPLVTFALSCGSWSSPAVRVYSPSEVGNELEMAKRNYLHASIGISQSFKLFIPKLLDWYMLDFAKDMESLVEWVSSQFSTTSGMDIASANCVNCEQPIQIIPYDFSFRYILYKY